MSLPKPSVVIFDMDGTTVRHLNPKLLGFMEWLDDTVYKVSRLWTWIFERKGKGPLQLTQPEQPVKPPKSIIVHKAIHKLRKKPVELLVEPCPGVMTVLEFLKQQDIPLALVSNGLGKGYGQDIVQKFGLDKYFGVTIFREDIRKSKPNPEPIILALSKLKDNYDDGDLIWYIGDRQKDVKAALRADDQLECRVIPIAYGLNAAVAGIKHHLPPEHVIMSYFVMLDALKKLFKNDKSKEKPTSMSGKL